MNGLGSLLRQRLRRDFVQLTLWIGGTVALAAAGFAGVLSSYGDEQARTALLATVMANPVILLLRGLPSGAGESQIVTFVILPWLLLPAAMMSTFLAVRHTRGDEEAGRLELLSATPASRWTPTVATTIHGVAANIVLGILVAAAFLANGAAAPGSVLVGATATLVGIVFFTVGLAAAQLMPTSRGAHSLATWTLLGLFVLAGIGNALGTPNAELTRTESSWLTWLSPFGWAENTRPFDGNDWAPIAPLAVAIVALLVGAFALQSRRDIGAAFFPARTGRADAPRSFGSNLALVTRVSRASVIGWAISGLLVGALSTSLGAVASEIGGLSPAVAEVLAKIGGSAGDLQTGLIAVFFVLVGILAACAGVQTVIRARQDETRGTAEIVLGASIDRVRWLGDYLVAALAAATLTIGAGIVGATVGAALVSGGGALARDALIAGAGQILPAWLFVALTGLVFVAAPRRTIGCGWALVMLGAAIGLFGPLFGMDESLTRISPFAAALVPTAGGVDVRGSWWILVMTVIALAAALTLVRRRDVAAGG